MSAARYSAAFSVLLGRSINKHGVYPLIARFSSAAASGLRVFPVRPRSKMPALPWKQFQNRAPTEEELRAWDGSDFNIGIVTGAPSGIAVLDLDSPEAIAHVESLGLPPTPTVRTARGLHLYFRLSVDGIRNSVNVGGRKMDVRGDGGFVVGAGSVHESGAEYQWLISPTDVPFAEFPTVLAPKPKAALVSSATARGVRTPVEPAPNGVDRYMAHVLAGALKKLSAAEEGTRNDTLFRVAASVARDCAGAGSDWGICADALAEVAAQIGLEPIEIQRTLENARQAGAQEPTRWLQVAAEHVYLGAQDQFFHPASGSYLKRVGFDGQFGDLCPAEKSFSGFLLNNGFIQKVHDITYRPLEPQGVIERDGVVWLNTFKPSDVVAVEGDPSPFVDFVSHLVPNEEERDHLLKMMAYVVRNPGRKLGHALLMRTREQGVGKSMLASIWSALVGEHNARKTTSSELESAYQGFLPGHLLIVCEELNVGKGHKIYNDLKDLITGETALVNEKFLRQRIWPNYATFVFLTNLDVPILIEDKDRRFFYIDSPASRRDPGYYAEFSAWWRSNLGVIRYHLDQVDLFAFEPFAPPPVTASKLRLAENSRSELTQDLALAISDRVGVLDRDIVTLDQVTYELGHIARLKSRKQLTKALQEVGGIPLGQQRTVGNARASVWAVRNGGLWPFLTPQERAEEFGRATGAFAQFDAPGIVVAHAEHWDGDMTGRFGAILVGEIPLPNENTQGVEEDDPSNV
ncbi:bifunctional DNA primase/polymerase [Sphingomonas sp. JC676]|uniref:bifunctional DNA primase/polymerase n=1 Tax=Sphingomonas sp. JC676 TaxID=2768065 RepID=UPI0016583C93|nr:bifunctional DNA primase/polymerase [Sphingomonas sp. JC676]MBC9033014.1 bifunctional DNA primase/polymerase [Sphingomonas sp. JC676]